MDIVVRKGLVTNRRTFSQDSTFCLNKKKKIIASYTDHVYPFTCLQCIQVLECLLLEFVVESGHHVVPAQLAQKNHRGSEDLGVSPPPNEMQSSFFTSNNRK